MKGIMIYETPLWGYEENVVYTQEVNDASYTLKQVGSDDITCYLEGIATKEPVTKATCNVNDTYDFETGALISLMKMCGLEKSAKAYAEIFDDTAYGDALIERDKLKEKVDDLYDLSRKHVEEIDQKNHEIISLKALKVSNEALKKDNESFRKTCEKLKEENERLNTSICAKEVLNAKLLKDYNAAQSAYEIMVEKSADLMDEVKKLEGENEKLKFDCEKLQHGYVDTDNVPSGHWDGDILDIVFLPGRACGKQYKALVELFKKIDQKKVDAAYKEAYNTTLPVWQKEFLNQMYGITVYRKTELPRTLDINGVTYRKGVSLKDLHRALIPTEYTWELKMPTKREFIWCKIKTFKGDSCVEVDWADAVDFLKDLEKEMPNIHWPTGARPTVMKPMFNYKYAHISDKIYFFIDDRYVTYGFDKQTSRTNIQYVTYLPPMRWDLFNKGRLVVKVSKENYAEFCSRVFSHFDKVGVNAFNHDCKFGYFMFNKDTDYVERILASDCGDMKEINRHKVVDWEDVK